MGHWYNPQTKERSTMPIPGWLPSVTTILAATRPAAMKQAIAAWQTKNPYNATRELQVSSNRGTAVHDWMVGYLDRRIPPPGDMAIAPYCHRLQPLLDHLLANCQLRSLGQPLFHLDFAGEPDLVFWDESRQGVVLMELKTRSKPMPAEKLHEAFLQATGYAEAYQFQLQEEIDHLTIVVLQPKHQFMYHSTSEVLLPEWRARRVAYVESQQRN